MADISPDTPARPSGCRRPSASHGDHWFVPMLNSAVLAALALFGLCAAATGCRGTSPRIVPSPYTSATEAARVLEIAPIGSQREAAVLQLEQAGIAGNFGQNQSIYYCDLWKQPSGEVWHINVTLLFDEAGKLYATRPAVPAASAAAASATEKSAAASAETSAATRKPTVTTAR